MPSPGGPEPVGFDMGPLASATGGSALLRRRRLSPGAPPKGRQCVKKTGRLSGHLLRSRSMYRPTAVAAIDLI